MCLDGRFVQGGLSVQEENVPILHMPAHLGQESEQRGDQRQLQHHYNYSGNSPPPGLSVASVSCFIQLNKGEIFSLEQNSRIL